MCSAGRLHPVSEASSVVSPFLDEQPARPAVSGGRKGWKTSSEDLNTSYATVYTMFISYLNQIGCSKGRHSFAPRSLGFEAHLGPLHLATYRSTPKCLCEYEWLFVPGPGCHPVTAGRVSSRAQAQADIGWVGKELSCLEVRYLQLQHSVLQDAFVSGGRDAGEEDPLRFTQPILELLESEREEVVLPHNALNPGGLVLRKTE